MGRHPGQEIAIESDWEQLSRGQTLGKRIGIGLSAGGGLGTTSLQMFQVAAENDDSAMPLCITLAPPRVNTLVAVAATAGPIPNLSSTQSTSEQNLNAGGFALANPFARVEWGIGGIQVSADIDILNGARFNVAASFVRITGFIGDPPLFAVSDGAYELAAFIGPGSGMSSNNCQRTIDAPAIPAVGAEGAVQVVPKFARKVRMTGSAGLGLVFVGSLRFYRNRTGGTPVCEAFFSGNTLESVVLPSGCYYFKFVSQMVTENMQAVFELAL